MAAPLAAALIVLFALAATQQTASSHWCTYPPLEDTFDYVDYVFSGTAVKGVNLANALEVGQPCHVVRIAIHTVYKGQLPPLVDVGSYTTMDQSFVRTHATSIAQRAAATRAALNAAGTPGLDFSLLLCTSTMDFRFEDGEHYLIFAEMAENGFLTTHECLPTGRWPQDPLSEPYNQDVMDVIGAGYPADPASAYSTLVPTPAPSNTPAPTRTRTPTRTPTQPSATPNYVALRFRSELTASPVASRATTPSPAVTSWWHVLTSSPAPRGSASTAPWQVTGTTTPPPPAREEGADDTAQDNVSILRRLLNSAATVVVLGLAVVLVVKTWIVRRRP